MQNRENVRLELLTCNKAVHCNAERGSIDNQLQSDQTVPAAVKLNVDVLLGILNILSCIQQSATSRSAHAQADMDATTSFKLPMIIDTDAILQHQGNIYTVGLGHFLGLLELQHHASG